MKRIFPILCILFLSVNLMAMSGNDKDILLNDDQTKGQYETVRVMEAKGRIFVNIVAYHHKRDGVYTFEALYPESTENEVISVKHFREMREGKRMYSFSYPLPESDVTYMVYRVMENDMEKIAEYNYIENPLQAQK